MRPHGTGETANHRPYRNPWPCAFLWVSLSRIHPGKFARLRVSAPDQKKWKTSKCRNERFFLLLNIRAKFATILLISRYYSLLKG